MGMQSARGRSVLPSVDWEVAKDTRWVLCGFRRQDATHKSVRAAKNLEICEKHAWCEKQELYGLSTNQHNVAPRLRG